MRVTLEKLEMLGACDAFTLWFQGNYGTGAELYQVLKAIPDERYGWLLFAAMKLCGNRLGYAVANKALEILQGGVRGYYYKMFAEITPENIEGIIKKVHLARKGMKPQTVADRAGQKDLEIFESVLEAALGLHNENLFYWFSQLFKGLTSQGYINAGGTYLAQTMRELLLDWGKAWDQEEKREGVKLYRIIYTRTLPGIGAKMPEWPRGDWYRIGWVLARNLEEVFSRTNNLNGYWGNNPGVLMYKNNPARSLSVGDMVVDESTGHAYQCESFGWNYLGGYWGWKKDRYLSYPGALMNQNPDTPD